MNEELSPKTKAAIKAVLEESKQANQSIMDAAKSDMADAEQKKSDAQARFDKAETAYQRVMDVAKSYDIEL